MHKVRIVRYKLRITKQIPKNVRLKVAIIFFFIPWEIQASIGFYSNVLHKMSLTKCDKQEVLMSCSFFKREFTPKNENSVINYPHVVPNPQDLRSSSEHQLRYF